MSIREAAKYSGVRFQTIYDNVHLLLDMLGDENLKRKIREMKH